MYAFIIRLKIIFSEIEVPPNDRNLLILIVLHILIVHGKYGKLFVKDNIFSACFREIGVVEKNTKQYTVFMNL